MIKEANVTLMVEDMERSVQFYVEVLGLKLKSRYGNDFAQVEAPGTIIALHPMAKEDHRIRGPEKVSIGFSVDSLEKSMAEFANKGISFSRTTDDKQVRLAFFNDPDGYPLYLSQSKWG